MDAFCDTHGSNIEHDTIPKLLKETIIIYEYRRNRVSKLKLTDKNLRKRKLGNQEKGGRDGGKKEFQILKVIIKNGKNVMNVFFSLSKNVV